MELLSKLVVLILTFLILGGLRGGKGDLYEGGIRIPFITNWADKILAGKESHLISFQMDFFDTMPDLQGENNRKTDGILFLSELLEKSEKQEKHGYLYFEFSEKGGQVAVIKGKWKGVKSNLKKNPNPLGKYTIMKKIEKKK